MSAGRDQILETVRRSLKRGQGDGDDAARARVEARLSETPRGPVPARAQIPLAEQVDLFEAMAVEQAATVARVARPEDVPAAVADYLKAANLAPRIRLAPDPELEGLPWDGQPLLEVETGKAEAADQVSVTGAFAGVAETGTLLLVSGPRSPTTLNFLPETHIAVLRASRMVGPYEDAWDRVRALYGRGSLPRTVNFITGPSRTADIEQTIQLGAHGPRRLHIVLIEDGAGEDGAGDGG
ncbi:MAG: lactate utilization protein [Proteobacteria bacterium]|nr:lactate utilization protein [Pseudomonadota bacterium]